MTLYASIDGAQRELTNWYANTSGAQRQLDLMYANINGVQRKLYDSGRFKAIGDMAQGDIFYLPAASNYGWSHTAWQVINNKLEDLKSPTQPYIVRGSNDIYYLTNMGALTWGDIAMIQPYRVYGYTTEIYNGTVTQDQSYAQNGVFAALGSLRNLWNLNGVIRGNLQTYGKFGMQLNEWVHLDYGLCPLYASYASLGWYATDSDTRRIRRAGGTVDSGGTARAWWLADFAGSSTNVTARITSTSGTLGIAVNVTAAAQNAYIFPIAFMEKSKLVQIQI